MEEDMNECGYHNDELGDYECSEPPWSESERGYCIFHSENRDKPLEDFEKGIQEKLDNEDYDFKGFCFPKRFDSKKYFSKQEFKKDVWFNSAKFLGNVSFEKAQFSGRHAFFIKTKFCGDGTSFIGAKFSVDGGTFFDEAKFSGKGDTSFIGAKFSGEGDTSFRETIFSGRETSFVEAKFYGKITRFNDAEFSAKEGISFENAEFSSEGGTYFTEAKFSGKYGTSFYRAKFSGAVSFIGSIFSNPALFDLSEFHGKSTSFTTVTFEEDVSFHMTVFSSDRAIFDQTTFGKRGKFKETKFLSGIFQFNCDLKNVSFIDSINLSSVLFLDSEWSEKKIYASKIFPLGEVNVCQDYSAAETEEEFKKAEKVCREIKNSYRRAGDKETSNNFLFSERECKRKSLSCGVKKILLLFDRHVLAYFLSPRLFVCYSLLVIMFWSIIFMYTGIEIKNTGNEIPRIIDYDLALGFDVALNDIFNSFILSLTSFSALGFAKVYPTLASHFLASFEAVLGMFLVACFVYSLGRTT